MPTNNQNTPEKLKTIKPSFLEFIKLVRQIRLDTLGKRGEIKIPKSELNKIIDLKTEYFIRQLINDGILELFSNRQARKIDRRGNITVSCNAIEKIDEYLKSLYVPCSSGLIIENNGKHIERRQSDKFYNFSNQDAVVLYFLQKNAGKLQTCEAIAEGCREKLGKLLATDQIRSILYSLRKRIKELGYNDNEMKEILPKKIRGGYVLKI